MENQLSVEMVKKLLNYAMRQACPICLTQGTIETPLVLDHEKDEHGNGKFRGLICQDCTKIIDFLDYLVKQRPETPLRVIMKEIEKRII